MKTYINTLTEKGFEIIKIVEPKPGSRLLELYSEYGSELKQPMFFADIGQEEIEIWLSFYCMRC